MPQLSLCISTGDICHHEKSFVSRGAYLNGGGVEGKQLIPGSFGVSIHVDQDVDSILVDTISCFAIARDLKGETTNFSKNR